jgi:RNA polymerase sigma factor (sigma-70 family)
MTQRIRPSSVLGYIRAALGPDARGLPDTELLARFTKNQDEGAFELLVWRHAGMVQRVCQAALRDYHAAEDVCQAVFLALARQAGAVGRNGNVAGWLYRVARRVAVRVAIRRQKLPSGTDFDLDQLPGPTAGCGDDEAKLLYEELDRLPEKYREPLVLCYLYGLTVAETAKRLGWPVGTVAGRVARARTRLHRRLSVRGLGAPSVALVALVGGPASALRGSFAAETARGAVAFVTGSVPAISGTVLELAKGATEAMTATKFIWAVGVLAICGTLVGGVWGSGQQQKEATLPTESRTERKGADAVAGRLATLEDRQRSKANLKQVGQALLGFESANGCLPTDIRDKNGKALLSWRVAVLPYLGKDDLRKEFHLDEAWDSEHNKKLLARMPDILRVSFQLEDAIETYYQVFAGSGTPFDPKAIERVPGGEFPHLYRSTVKVADGIPDGTANTLGVAEAGQPVPWTKPVDLSYDPKKPLPLLVGPFSDVLHVTTVDGRVHSLRRDTDNKVLRAMIESADGSDPPDFEKYAAPPPAVAPGEKRDVKKGSVAPGDPSTEKTAQLERDERERLKADKVAEEIAADRAAEAAKAESYLSRPAPAVSDLNKIDRKITKEPKYESKPYYALLAFGPAAEKRVWLILDGDVLYIDRNGNGDLTDEGERILPSGKDKIYPAGQQYSHTQKFSLKGLVPPVGKDVGGDYQLDHLIKDSTFVPKTDFDKVVARNYATREQAYLWRVVGKERASIPITFVPIASEAQITHIGGPLSVVLRNPSEQKFRRGSNPDVLEVMIGTPGLLAKNDGMQRPHPLDSLRISEVPADVHPKAEIEFPRRTAAEKPIRLTVILDQRCCGDNFYAPVPVPADAGAGMAKVVVTFPNSTPCTVDIPLVDEKRVTDDRPKEVGK